MTIVALKGEYGHDISRVVRVEGLESDEDSVERREVMDSSRIESVVRLERIDSENGDVMADVANMTKGLDLVYLTVLWLACHLDEHLDLQRMLLLRCYSMG